MRHSRCVCNSRELLFGFALSGKGSSEKYEYLGDIGDGLYVGFVVGSMAEGPAIENYGLLSALRRRWV